MKLLRVFSFGVFILTVLLCASSFVCDIPTAHASASWYDMKWSYRTQITFNHDQVASSTAALNTDFPVLISATMTALKFTGAAGGGGHVASSTGGDIIFTDSDGTSLLNYEIESYASSTGTIVAWVKIPSLATSTDTSIYMYYGNAVATAPVASVATGVWDDGGA
jgi:biopolymer transport protein ExbB